MTVSSEMQKKAVSASESRSGDARFEQLEETMKHHQYCQDALIEVLHAAQKLFGFLESSLLHLVARQLKLPPSRVYGVATFYHLFTLEPRGRHTCIVCIGTACYVKGANNLLAAVSQAVGVEPGQTTPNGALTLRTVRCLEPCGIAPVAVLDGAEPELARNGIRLRQFGQQIIEALGGRKIHPAWCVPGGVRSPLSIKDCDWIRSRIAESRTAVLDAICRFKGILDKHRQEAETFGNFPTLYLGLIAADGTWENYEGKLRVVDGEGQIVADGIDPGRYRAYLGEAAESWSYLKSPYYRPLGYLAGIYRVGPLARLNLYQRMGTPLADKELAEFRQHGAGAVNSAFFYHYARLIEILAGIERIEQMGDDPDLQSEHLRADAGVNQLEGVGCSEAPRGTLFHHYHVNGDGLIQKVNLLIVTGQNNLAMNRTVLQIAQHYIKGPQIPEGILNRLEAGIRAFDPCLSCSTHAAGQMPLRVQLFDAKGNLLDEVRRD